MAEVKGTLETMIDKNFTLVDNGLFVELAIRLARDTEGKVRCHVPWRGEFPRVEDRAVGSGLENEGVEWCEDPYVDEVFDDTDCYCFPDIFFAGEQQLLKRTGKPVFGSNIGDQLETRRIWFRHLQEELGMPVPESKVITGWTALNDYLKSHNEHCFIKTTSKIRGTMETHEFFDYEQDEYWLWNLRLKLCAAAEHAMFLIEKPIESPFETGLDLVSVDGQAWKTPLQGIEVKGKLMLSSAQTNSPTPKPLDDALTVLAPELKRRQYRNFLSCEFRRDILTDFCARAPNPGLGCEMEMIANIGEIIYHAALGELIEPVYEYEFGIQAAIFHDHEDGQPKQFRIPAEVRRFVKLMEFCKVGELYQILPRLPHGPKIGWLIGVGHTIQEAANHLQENAKAFEHYPFEIKIDSLPEAVKQASEMEAKSFEFTDQTIPNPEEVLDET